MRSIERPPHVEIILPVFNEEGNLPALVASLDRAAAELSGRATVSYLFVDDGSSDGSPQMLQSLFEKRKDIRTVTLVRNYGHSAALACGMEYFRGDVAVVMDADLQDRPDVLSDMFAKWERGANTVVAARGERSEKSRVLFHAFYFLLRRSSRFFPKVGFGTYCLLDNSIVKRLKVFNEKNRYFPGLVSYSSGAIESVLVNRDSRQQGESRVGMAGLFQLAITALTSFSTAPIRMVSVVGFACGVFSFALGIVIVAIRLFSERAIPGWASILAAVLFGVSIQVLCMAIIGEYVARIYDEVKSRPLFFVDQLREKVPAAAAKFDETHPGYRDERNARSETWKDRHPS